MKIKSWLAESDSDFLSLAHMEEEIFPDSWSLETIKENVLVGPGMGMLYEDSEIIKGYSLCQIILDEAELLRLGVSPKARRQGIGKQILEDLKNYFEGIGVKRCFLEVREDNIEARSLYEKAGFCEIYRRPAYYHDGCDGIIYRWERGDTC